MVDTISCLLFFKKVDLSIRTGSTVSVITFEGGANMHECVYVYNIYIIRNHS
jgi:hypothetical protein